MMSLGAPVFRMESGLSYGGGSDEGQYQSQRRANRA
jgi:hypothetical protein